MINNLQDLTNEELQLATVSALKEMQDRFSSFVTNPLDDVECYDPSGETEYTLAEEKLVDAAIYQLEQDSIWFTTVGDAIVLLDE